MSRQNEAEQLADLVYALTAGGPGERDRVELERSLSRSNGGRDDPAL